MTKISFYCVRCEGNRKIVVEGLEDAYIVGKCSVCKSVIKINLKRFNDKHHGKIKPMKVAH